jgi:hypothetical protein
MVLGGLKHTEIDSRTGMEVDENYKRTVEN